MELGLGFAFGRGCCWEGRRLWESRGGGRRVGEGGGEEKGEEGKGREREGEGGRGREREGEGGKKREEGFQRCGAIDMWWLYMQPLIM